MAAANLQAAGINTAVLTVAKAGDGAGVVTDGGGVNCGDLCGGSYSAGSAVTLTATPDADSRVAGWSVPACGTKLVCTVTMNESVTVTVTFSPIAQTPAPVVSGLSASTAPAGTTVTIFGSDLDTVSAVDFNGTPAEFSVLSSTSVSATVPCAAAAGPITVTADGGTASSARFTVANAKPTVTSFTPSSARPADTVTVTGTYLACLSSLAVGKVSAAIAASSHTRVSFLVPDAAVTAALTVRNAVGAVTTSAKLTVTAVPRISGFSPLHALPGATVTVSGTGLSGATSATVGGTTAKVKVVSPAQLTVTVPAGASTGELTVKVPTGTVTAPTDFTVDIPAPTVSSASVSSGPVGTSILVKGSNFTQSAVASIAGASQRRVVVSPTAMVVTVSAGTSTGSLRVTTAGGAATLGVFTVTAGVASTTITKVSAKSAVGGSVITITGTNVGSLAAVKVAGETAGFVVLTPTTAAVALPIGARTGTVSGVTATGAGISGPTVAVLAGAAAPTVTAVSPASAAVGTWVKVSGANLAAVTSVAWDNAVVDYYVTAANAIYIRVPRGAVSGPISVATSGGSALSPSIKVT